MAERAYTVPEIAALRQAVEMKWLYGRYSPTFQNGGMSRTYMESDKTKAVEEITRTHMLAGHTAEDLYASERPAVEPGAGT